MPEGHAPEVDDQIIEAGRGLVGGDLLLEAQGTDPAERTELVTGGVFSLCRNPIYTFMLIAWTGLALLVPTWLSIASVPAGIVAFEVQVRLVEEPFLFRTHGRAFIDYATRVGRFVPGVGRLRRRWFTGPTP